MDKMKNSGLRQILHDPAEDAVEIAAVVESLRAAVALLPELRTDDRLSMERWALTVNAHRGLGRGA